jgi:D-alanine-D-alanine ligase
MSGRASVLVLGGGPDAEREVSLRSAAGVAAALREAGHEVEHAEIGALTAPELAALRGEVVFPVLHGAWGEGGPMQDLLERDGRPFVGCRARAARLAMDKVATKLAASAAGLATAPGAVLNRADAGCPLPLPVVVKPVHEGSSVGLMMCHGEHDWLRAHARVASGEFGDRAFMVEGMIRGRELTVGVVAGEGGALGALPLIEIVAAGGVYDYDAKYQRTDTRYIVGPDLPGETARALQRGALELARRIGVRHLCRVDFLLDGEGGAWLLEVNTMPGFTATSLLPKAAAHTGITMATLVSRLVCLAASGLEG